MNFTHTYKATGILVNSIQRHTQARIVFNALLELTQTRWHRRVLVTGTVIRWCKVCSFCPGLRFLVLDVSLLIFLRSPHSLVRRAGPDIDLELNGFSSMDRDRRQVFPPVQLAPVGNYLYTVQGGGWNGQGAIAQHVALQTYLAWGTSGVRGSGRTCKLGH